MIDTIKFKIKCEPKIIDKFLRICDEFEGFNHEDGKTIYQLYKKQVNLGSHDYKVNVMVDDPFVYIELSIPKFLYGSNLYLFNCNNLNFFLTKLSNALSSYFHVHLPSILDWEIQRLDLCYAWKFYDDSIALKVLQYFQNCEFARKTKIRYSSSVMWKGTDSSLKVYLKGPEFFKHDYHRMIKDLNLNEAENLLMKSRGIVRFEITIRRAEIDRLFIIPNNAFNIFTILTNEYVQNILSRSLKKLLGSECTTMCSKDVFARFVCFRPTKALRLYTFFKLSLSADPVDHMVVLAIPDSTRRRYKKILRDLKVGIPDDISGTDISLAIPSEFSVGEFPPSNTGGTAQF
jgi:hypothetical protein